MDVICIDFERKQKLKKFIIFLKIVTKKMMCKLRQYANVQSEITLMS